MRVLLVIPAYNEESNIARVVTSVIDAGYDYIVVNDGSTDSTLEICRDHGYEVLNLSRNLGIGGAVQTGHKYALEHGYDVDIQFDGDGQHDLSCIPSLLHGVEQGADLVIGSRFISEENEFQSTRMRRVGIRWLQWMIQLRTGRKITDSTSGFRACGRKAIELFARNYPSDYPEPESVACAVKNGLAVSEIPVIMHERVGGASSIGGLSAIYYMVKVSLAILFTSAKGGASLR